MLKNGCCQQKTLNQNYAISTYNPGKGNDSYYNFLKLCKYNKKALSIKVKNYEELCISCRRKT